MLVPDVLGLHHAHRLLHLVPLREIGAQRAVHDLEVARLHLVDIVVARAPDAPLHDLELAPVHLAGGEDEAQQLVGRLGPAVPVVRARRHLGRHHVEAAVPDEPLVVVGGVVGAAHHHPPHALLEGDPADVVGERRRWCARPRTWRRCCPARWWRRAWARSRSRSGSPRPPPGSAAGTRCGPAWSGRPPSGRAPSCRRGWWAARRAAPGPSAPGAPAASAGRRSPPPRSRPRASSPMDSPR